MEDEKEVLMEKLRIYKIRNKNFVLENERLKEAQEPVQQAVSPLTIQKKAYELLTALAEDALHRDITFFSFQPGLQMLSDDSIKYTPINAELKGSLPDLSAFLTEAAKLDGSFSFLNVSLQSEKDANTYRMDCVFAIL